MAISMARAKALCSASELKLVQVEHAAGDWCSVGGQIAPGGDTGAEAARQVEGSGDSAASSGPIEGRHARRCRE